MTLSILLSLYDKFSVNLYIKIYREKKSFKQIKIVPLFAIHMIPIISKNNNKIIKTDKAILFNIISFSLRNFHGNLIKNNRIFF